MFSKHRAREEQAKILHLKRIQIEEQRADGLPWYAQPSIRAAIRQWYRRRH